MSFHVLAYMHNPLGFPLLMTLGHWDCESSVDDLVRVQVIEGPRYAGHHVEPEAAEGRQVLSGNHAEVVTILLGDVHGADEELEDYLQLPSDKV